MTMIWKEMGWSSIIYLAALTGVEREVYEAALADGAGRFRRMWHVSLPALIPVFTIMLIFAAGSLIQDDFDQIFNLYNASVYRVADVLSTYTYRTGLVQMNYSFATAVGLFKNLLAFALVVLTNGIARKINDYSIW
jgi:putative aldouronate transport system permease protein